MVSVSCGELATHRLVSLIFRTEKRPVQVQVQPMAYRNTRFRLDSLGKRVAGEVVDGLTRDRVGQSRRKDSAP